MQAGFLFMNPLFDFWAALNTVLIMLTLGLSFDRKAQDHHYMTLARAALGYNLLFPLAGWCLVAYATDWFSEPVLMAMMLCIVCAGGTSAGAFVSRVGGSVSLAGTLIVVLLGLSLIAVTALSFSGVSTFSSVPVTQLAIYLLLITLVPFLSGIVFMRLQPQYGRSWHPKIDRAGSVMTLLLVLALTVRYAIEILSGPKGPLYAAIVLVLLFVLPPLVLEQVPAQKRTIVMSTLIRNLTLVLSLLAVLPDQNTLLPTVLAFGLLMYLTCGVLMMAWRR